MAESSVDHDFINQHTIGFQFLRDTVALWPAERVEQISGVPSAQLRAAAEILGAANSLVFSVLQGVYQSNQATAEAHIGWTTLLQTAQALRDKEFIAACTKLGGETEGQRSWLQTRIKQAAPQALLVDV